MDEEECQAEIEKSLAKLRWEYSARERHNDENEPPSNEKKWHDTMTGEMDFSLMKATDLPFNKRIIVPEPMDNETEIVMQNLKSKLNACTRRYTENQRGSKTQNLSEEERRGLLSLKEKKKRNEIIIY